MNRAFLYLYLLIVFSVIGIGWGIDKIWQIFDSQPEENAYVHSLVSVLEHNLRQLPQTKMEEYAAEVLSGTPLHIDLYNVDEFADTGLGQDILVGDIVTVFSGKKEQISYKRVAGTPVVIGITLPKQDDLRQYIYDILLVGFYLAIALVIYFWVWPLSKDLRELELQTQRVGKNGVPGKVNLGPRSAIYRLANSFNKMSDRIRDLIASHKEMTYAVSHELRTPLARMKFAFEMIEGDIDAKRLRKQLAGLREDVSEMNSLVNELLAFAGFEQSEQKLDQKPGDIKALIRNVLKTASSHRVDFDQKIHDKLGDTEVFCEWYLMERVLRNIVQNAHRYTESKILVTLWDRGNNYYISVEDDGMGIPEDDRVRVFQSFVRLRMNTSFDRSGFGLGLAIVARIMKWHHGKAWADESRWGGAKFVVSWPKPPSLTFDDF